MISLVAILAAAIQFTPAEMDQALREGTNSFGALDVHRSYTSRYNTPAGLQRHYCNLSRHATDARLELSRIDEEGKVVVLDMNLIRRNDGKTSYVLTEADHAAVKARLFDLTRDEARYKSYCENGV